MTNQHGDGDEGILPEIDFNYGDSDVFSCEIAEFYSYSENSEFFTHQCSFYSLMKDRFGFDPPLWRPLDDCKRIEVLDRLLDLTETSNCNTMSSDVDVKSVDVNIRLSALQSFSYLCQGCWIECQSDEECFKFMRDNICLMLSRNVFTHFISLLNGFDAKVYTNYDKNESVYYHELRCILSVLYLMVENVRNGTGTQEDFKESLISSILDVDIDMMQFTKPLLTNKFYRWQNTSRRGSLVSTIFDMLTQFCSNSVANNSVVNNSNSTNQIIQMSTTTGGVFPSSTTNIISPPYLSEEQYEKPTNTFPVKKVLLLLWKVILLSLGGVKRMAELKVLARKIYNLKVLDEADTVEICKTMRAASPPASAADILEATSMRRSNRQFRTNNAYSNNQSDQQGRPRLSPSALIAAQFKNFPTPPSPAEPLKVLSGNCAEHRVEDKTDAEKESTSDLPTIIESENGSVDDTSDETSQGLTSELDATWPSNDRDDDMIDDGIESDAIEDSTNENGSDDDDGMKNDDCVDQDMLNDKDKEIEDEIRVVTPCVSQSAQTLPRKLPWALKVGTPEISSFFDQVRDKFIGPTFAENDRQKGVKDVETVAGLPPPVHEAVKVLKKHQYTSLAEAQVHRESLICKYPFSTGEVSPTPDTCPLLDHFSLVESLYQSLLPSLPQYSVVLLKILLATSATPTTTISFLSSSSNQVNDQMKPFETLDNQTPHDLDGHENMLGGSSFSPKQHDHIGVTTQSGLKDAKAVRVEIDANRDREIIIKAVSATLVLLLKHFKINHVYQFEFMSQHLVFANCIPLIVKFFNQSIMAFITAKNNITVLDFPSCVIGDYTPQNMEDPTDIGVNSSPCSISCTDISPSSHPSFSYFCWRNIFSCINLLKVLNKVTKGKQARIMRLVVFKSAPILKRTLRVRHSLMQLYILKLLKMQTKYLGRQWRKSNMKTISAIYTKVRHRINDDWAFGNDVESHSWDFQAEESVLRTAIDKFNYRRYNKSRGVLNPAYVNTTFNSPEVNTNTSPSLLSKLMSGGNNPATGGEMGDVFVKEIEAFDFSPAAVCRVKDSIVLSEEFKNNYEEWLRTEVYGKRVDWDLLLKV